MNHTPRSAWTLRDHNLQHEYTDDELVAELNRRGRFATLTSLEEVPLRYVRAGYPLAEQIRNACTRIGHEMARGHLDGSAVLPATKLGNYRDPITHLYAPDLGDFRRVTARVTYLTEKCMRYKETTT